MSRESGIEIKVDHMKLWFIGKIDGKEKEYYYTRTRVPASIDLSNTVFHAFPYEDEDGKFGIELVVREYNPDDVKKRKERARMLRQTNNDNQIDTDNDQGE